MFLRAGHCGSCEGASTGAEGSRDRGIKAVRPMIGALGDNEEGANEEARDREVAEGIAVEELDMEEQREEAEESKGVNRGTKPSRKEVEEHERTHLPFRNWCKHCVFGKAKSNPHRKADEREGERPVISIDYMYLHERKIRGQTRWDRSPEDGMPIVVMHDSDSKGTFAFVAPNKGECEYAVRRASQDIDKIMGYKRFILRGDQEPALRTLMDRIAAMCGEQAEVEQVMQEETPVGE